MRACVRVCVCMRVVHIRLYVSCCIFATHACAWHAPICTQTVCVCVCVCVCARAYMCVCAYVCVRPRCSIVLLHGPVVAPAPQSHLRALRTQAWSCCLEEGFKRAGTETLSVCPPPSKQLTPTPHRAQTTEPHLMPSDEFICTFSILTERRGAK